jgi:hypothetical protein
MDHKVDKAVGKIRDSQISGLADEEMRERMLLEARAFAALKQWDNALDLIAVDQSDDTKRLRADVYWESGNWALAGQKSEEILGNRWSDGSPLTDIERSQLLRTAVAYSLANDEASLARVRDRFAAKMKGTPDANLFQVLSADIDQHGLAFRDAAARIASLDTLEAFMKDFSKRKADAGANFTAPALQATAARAPPASPIPAHRSANGPCRPALRTPRVPCTRRRCAPRWRAD